MLLSDMHVKFICGGGWGVAYALSNNSLQLVNTSLMKRMQFSAKVYLLHVFLVNRILMCVYVQRHMLPLFM